MCKASSLQAETVPLGIGQGYLEDFGARNPPVSLAAAGSFAGVALREAVATVMPWAAEARSPYLEEVRPRYGPGSHPAVWLTEPARGSRSARSTTRSPSSAGWAGGAPG